MDTQEKFMIRKGDLDKGWMRKVDEKVKLMGAKAGIRVNKADRNLYLIQYKRHKVKGQKEYQR